METSSQLQAQDLIKTENIVKGSPDETLSQALSRLSRSHDALFVFDAERTYKGVINPYYTTFKARYPGETKLETCLFRPPVLARETSIWDIAYLMAESKIYYLPVIDRREFVGIVSINRVLKAMLSHPGTQPNHTIPYTKNVITIRDTATIKQAHVLMRDNHVSRLPVVNGTGRLVGIVTRFDIREAFARPREKQTFLSRSGEKEPMHDQPISAYYKKMVYTVQKDTTAREILNILVSQNIGSVVVTDASHQPLGIISTHDVLKMIASFRPKQEPAVSIHSPDDFIDKTALVTASGTLLRKITRHSSQPGKLEVLVECDKNTAGKIRHYTVKILLHQPAGQAVVATHTDFNWKTALVAAGKKLQRQLQE